MQAGSSTQMNISTHQKKCVLDHHFCQDYPDPKISDEVENFGVTLKAAQENYNTSLNHAIEGIKEQLDNTKKKNGVESKQVKNGVESKQVKKALKSILSTQDEVWGILRENTRLIEQFGQLAMGTASLDTLEVNSLPK